MKKKDDLLTITPMEDYIAPKLPTYADDLPDISKKIPRRWKRRAVIAATVGILGTTALTGCSVIEHIVPNHPIVCPDLHWGGAGMSPIYVVQLTEQEALELIRNQLEEAGLSLSEVSPARTVTIDGVYVDFEDADEPHRILQDEIEMQLVDEESEIGIALVSLSWRWSLDSACTREIGERITQTFSAEHGISVGAFFGTEGFIWDGEEVSNHEERVDEERVIIEDKLTDQVQNFIEQLRREGIVE